MKTLLIITGWTRGLGEGILRAYTDIHGKELVVIGIARSRNPELQGYVLNRVSAFHPISADLGEPSSLAAAMDQLKKICSELRNVDRKILINNAALLDPIGTLPSISEPSEFYRQAGSAFAVNCIAPALLSGFFINRICTKGNQKHNAPQANLILNISSGASQGPMPGAAVYSMTKSALNSLSISLVSDQDRQAPVVKAIALSPGMVETAMQEDLRSRSVEQFPNVEYFKEAASTGAVASHLEVGRRIATLDYDSLESGSYYHLGNL